MSVKAATYVNEKMAKITIRTVVRMQKNISHALMVSTGADAN